LNPLPLDSLNPFYPKTPFKKFPVTGLERFGLPPEIGFFTGSTGIKPNHPTLILIHGAGASSKSFLPQIRQLDRFINILVLDLPGHGQTPGPGMTTIPAYADWVHQTLKRSEIKHYYLGGHSMGGAIGLEMGLLYPDRILGLILLATAADFRVFPDLLKGLEESPSETLALINRRSYGQGTSSMVIEQSLRLLQQTPLQVIQGDFLACSRFDRREEIKNLHCPVLILHGEQDITLPSGSARFLQSQIPGSSSLVLSGTAHMVMLEKYKEVNQAIHDFILKSWPSSIWSRRE
jgi:pimeloyl-ACP methyl ester carboxylesterase